MNEDFIEENFPRWMQPAMVDQDADRLQVFQGASVAAAQDLRGHELSSVLAAHGTLNEEVRGWMGAHLRGEDQNFVSDGKDELLQRLSAVAVLRSAVTDLDDAATLAVLAVGSAQFVDMDPVIEELPAIALGRLSEIGRELRSRDDEVPDFSTAIGKLPQARKANPEAGETIDPNQLAADIAAQTQAIKKLAASLDSEAESAAGDRRSLDEEVEMLWWVISERDEQGVEWGARPPIERAVAAASELATRTTVVPGPPSATNLLRRLLGDEGTEEVTLATLADEAARQQIEFGTDNDHPLLPLASAVDFRAQFGTSDDAETWQKAVRNKLGIALDIRRSLAEGSIQLYRELQMIRLLTDE